MRSDWFQITDVGDGIWVFLETMMMGGRQLGMPVNCHLIIGEKRSLLFDTGTGVHDIWAKVQRIRPRRPKIVINSHCHWDHVGGNIDYPDIRIHTLEFDTVGRPNPAMFSIWGMAAYHPRKPKVRLNDGDVIDLGGRALRVLHTPGHSAGSISFYEEATGFVFTGDAGCESGLALNGDDSDPAAALASLERLIALYPKKVFPGHGLSPLDPSILGRLAEALRKVSSGDIEGEPVMREEHTVGMRYVADHLAVVLPPPRKAA